MKAMVYSQYGSPDVLRRKEIDKPTPLDNEILIRVYAAEATKADCELRSFKFAVKWFWLPLRIVMGIRRPKREVLGGYFAGEVEAVGNDVVKFKQGDQVFGATKLRFGAYAEYLSLPDNYTIVPKPINMNYEEAAAVPLGGLNALHFLRKAKIQKGEKVLVNGAGGSIGTFGVQIAKAMGAEVTAVDSGIKETMLRRIGVDHFFDYAKDDFTKTGERYDVILDMVAGSSYDGCLKSLNPKGRYLMANPRLFNMLRSVLTSLVSDKRVFFAFAEEKEEELLTLKKMIEEGSIKSIVDNVYSLEQAAEAHHRVETEQRLGCVVIAISDASS
ncbi:NAD(P)-dependent alcohol dehydrogenase [Sedimenticola selenatireducens]|uniref:NAD(P)-dependent alcohol dehydrogenase n=1 Tax=Sedimenticola selenatireducens TaxID=191960 RepID=A0A558DR19_9GAMM|nr:NAD(P)-dependent alcohol dehydrogenase [Sedimenticola selenatireducens]TVO73525.1 NAD(P)-dependent alcohol dehydrogenase [Sedimenticola selenatireducens]TVT63466.1 MAG: NAD(P)-dependent alcohol dehydrogenase [Sedimenticola selenatireducens]